jgi:hypothetical protein
MINAVAATVWDASLPLLGINAKMLNAAAATIRDASPPLLGK